MAIETWAGLDSTIHLILLDALDEVGKFVEDRMVSFIDQDVYVGQNQQYEDTYEFRNSVTKDPAKIVRPGELRVKVYHDTSKIKSDPENFVHGSNYWSPNNIATYLPEILAFNKSGDFFGSGWWQNRNNYFYDTLNSLTKSGELSRVFKSALRKRGLTVR